MNDQTVQQVIDLISTLEPDAHPGTKALRGILVAQHFYEKMGRDQGHAPAYCLAAFLEYMRTIAAKLEQDGGPEVTKILDGFAKQAALTRDGKNIHKGLSMRK